MDAKRIIHEQSLPLNESISITLQVNGEKKQLQAMPAALLVDLLRNDLGLTGTKRSCDIGRCGACSVIMNDSLVNSCLVMAYQANHASISTIEGEGFSFIQDAFLKEGGFQCGYCTPGMIIAAKVLLDAVPIPTEKQIREGLSGNLCRCTGYSSIIRAVQRAAAMKLIIDRCDAGENA